MGERIEFNLSLRWRNTFVTHFILTVTHFILNFSPSHNHGL